MDLTAPARDIEELVAAFAEIEGTELVQMKELWRARNFSFIHEARPKDVIPSFYAQGLFSSALSHVVGDGPLSWKLGGFYVLYTLHGTQQQQEACYRIYLSLEELEALQALVKEIKKRHLVVALKVVRKMFAENVFLFGSVSANQKRIAATMARLVRQANTRIHQARCRLLTDVPIEEHLRGHLGQELGLYQLTHVTEEYAAAKRRALSENLEEGADPDVGGKEKTEQTLGVDLMKDANNWDAHKLELLTMMQQQQQQQQQGNQFPGSANIPSGNSERRKADVSQNGKQQRTISEYERELRERDLERELAEQLDRTLDDED